MDEAYAILARHCRSSVMRMHGVPGAADYKRGICDFPVNMRDSSLSQALAWLLARKTDGHRALYNDIEAWMTRDNRISPYAGTEALAPRLLNAVIDGSPHDYRVAFAEIDSYLAVLKLHAEVFLGGTEAGAEKGTAEAGHRAENRR